MPILGIESNSTTGVKRKKTMPFSYCTLIDIQNALGGEEKLKALSDNTGQSINTNAIESAMYWATDQIDSRARLLPVFDWHDNIPTKAVSVSVVLSIYKLYLSVWSSVPDDVKAQFESAMNDINSIGQSSIWDNNSSNKPSSVIQSNMSFGTSERSSNMRFNRSNTDLM